MVRADFSLESEDRALLGDLVPEDLDLTYCHWRYPAGQLQVQCSPAHAPRQDAPRPGCEAHCDRRSRTVGLRSSTLRARRTKRARTRGNARGCSERAAALADQLEASGCLAA